MTDKMAEQREKDIERMKLNNSIQLLRLKAEDEFGIKPGHKYTKEERIRFNIDYMLWLERNYIIVADRLKQYIEKFGGENDGIKKDNTNGD